MPFVFVITAEEALRQSLDRRFRYCRGTTVHWLRPPVAAGLIAPSSGGGAAHDAAFPLVGGVTLLADQIEKLAQEHGGDGGGLRGTIGLVDIAFSELAERDKFSADLNPLRKDAWGTAVSLLILAFPEVQWVFLPERPEKQAADDSAATVWRNPHFFERGDPMDDPLTLSDAGFEPLFDPSGLRSAVREAANRALKKPQGEGLATRIERAAAIDEEVNYAYFHAYTAYRFGYRGFVVPTRRMLNALSGSPAMAFALSDHCLEFPDGAMSLPDSDKFPTDCAGGDADAQDAASKISADDATRLRNACTLRKMVGYDNGSLTFVTSRGGDPIHGGPKIIHKPSAGMFALQRDAGFRVAPDPSLLSRDENGCSQDEAKPVGWGQRLRLLLGQMRWVCRLRFIFGPMKKENAATPTPRGSENHAAHGLLLLIVNRLLCRADRLLVTGDNVLDAVQGATLALDAAELLDEKTPTSHLQAIALRHKLETIAECLFHGVGQNPDINARINEVIREVERAGRWYAPPRREEQILNAQISVLNELIVRYREFNRFDEEGACAHEMQHRIARSLWVKGGKRPGPRWAAWLFASLPLHYFSFVLSGFWRFFSVVVIIYLVFGSLFAAYCPCDEMAASRAAMTAPLTKEKHPFTLGERSLLGVQFIWQALDHVTMGLLALSNPNHNQLKESEAAPPHVSPAPPLTNTARAPAAPVIEYRTEWGYGALMRGLYGTLFIIGLAHFGIILARTYSLLVRK